MELKTKFKNILKINAKQRDSSRKAVKALVYNEITEGEYKGWLLVNHLIPPEGVKMSVWTKEQKEYLDNEFGPIKKDIVDIKKDVVDVKKDVVDVKKDVVDIKKDIKMILNILKNK